MAILITDNELMAYVEGTMTDAERRALERRAVETHQADLLLAVSLSQNAVDADLADMLWGEDEMKEETVSTKNDYRVAAMIDKDLLKK